jgi:hypothetical protein
MMRFRKNDHAHNLLAAVERYIRANGGKVIVIGGIEIQKWPDDGEFKFKVAVGCSGRQPKKPESKDGQS